MLNTNDDTITTTHYPHCLQVRTPTVVAALEGEEIANVHVYNGCEHTLAVTRDGKIFSFGYNYRGQVSACRCWCIVCCVYASCSIRSSESLVVIDDLVFVTLTNLPRLARISYYVC